MKDELKRRHTPEKGAFTIVIGSEEDDSKAPKPSREKGLLLAALLISLATAQVVYSNIATFLPPYRTVKHPMMSDFAIGTIIA